MLRLHIIKHLFSTKVRINVEAIRSIWSFKRILAFAKDIYKRKTPFPEHL